VVRCAVCTKVELAYVEGLTRTSCYYCGPDGSNRAMNRAASSDRRHYGPSFLPWARSSRRRKGRDDSHASRVGSGRSQRRGLLRTRIPGWLPPNRDRNDRIRRCGGAYMHGARSRGELIRAPLRDITKTTESVG
jgi:hypothetical protein